MGASMVVVGAGGISNPWFEAIAARQVTVKAVVDLNIDAAKAQAAKYHLTAECSTDMVAMIKKHNPDFVLDLTVPGAHCHVTTTALGLGCHVIGEKPMAATMEQAKQMVEASEKSGKLYMVSQSRRFVNSHDSARLTIAQGLLGQITTVNCDFYIGAHFGGFRDEMDSPLILDMSIHHFDMMRSITGADPVAVYTHEFNPAGSWYKGNASASCIFEMSDGVVFNYRGSWCSEGCHTSWNGDWRFVGDKGTMMLEKDHAAVGQVVKSAQGFHVELGELQPVQSPMKFEGFAGGLNEMLTYLVTGKTPVGECHDNIKSLAMVFSAIESAQKGCRIPVKW